MPNMDASGELASARLDLPPTRAHRRRRGIEPIRALHATLRRDERGVLLISIGTEPASAGGIDVPALAYLQFAGHIEDAIAEVLTNSAARADR